MEKRMPEILQIISTLAGLGDSCLYPNTWEVKVGGSGVHSQSQLYNKFKPTSVLYDLAPSKNITKNN